MNNAHVVDETANIMATLHDGTRLLAKLNWPHICGNAHLESTLDLTHYSSSAF